MMLELLVASVCLGGKGNGCSQCLSAYYHQNHDLQEIVRSLEYKSKYLLKDKELLIYVATPIYAAVSGETATFILHENLTLGINIKNSSLIFVWTY